MPLPPALPLLLQQAKPDMVACKQLSAQHTPAPCHGHIPGITPGMVFTGKGELCILGIHRAIVRGIDARWVAGRWRLRLQHVWWLEYLAR